MHLREVALNCLAAISISPLLKTETIVYFVELINDQDQDLYVCKAALRCLAAMTPSLEKETLASIVEPIKDKLNDQDADVREVVCNLMVRILVNPDNDLTVEIDPSSVNTSNEQMVVQSISTWVKQIKIALNQSEEKNVVVCRNNGDVSVKTFRDDSLIGVKKTPLIARLEAPTFFIATL